MIRPYQVALPAFLFCVATLLLVSCSSPPTREARSIDLAAIEFVIPLPIPTPQQKAMFNRDVPGVPDSVTTTSGRTVRGMATRNRVFYDTVLRPLIVAHKERLLRGGPVGFVNNVAVSSFRMFQTFFGDDFYRWGGDLFDLDQPQETGTRSAFRFGLDCSGFVTLPYMIALDLGVIRPEDPGGEFTPEGFALAHSAKGIPDRGGRGGTSNRFRLDTPDLALLGREVARIPRGESVTQEQLALLQPGDLVVRVGHVGILVEIEGDLFYLESGGVVVPSNGYRPCRAEDAIRIFARRSDLVLRRALPDRKSEPETAR